MRVLLFFLLIGLGLVMHQAVAGPVEEADAKWQPAASAHECSGDHDRAKPDGDMDCGMHATCCPAVVMVIDDAPREHLAFAHRPSPYAEYSSPSSPPAAPPPRR